VHSGFSLTEDCSVAVCMASSSTALPELVIGSTADWSPQTLTNMTEQIADSLRDSARRDSSNFL
jgi:hypothetical protein